MIQRDCVMNLLIEACPSFTKKWEKHLHDIWDRESKTILYTDFSEFARHLTSLVKSDEYYEFELIFDKIEYLLHEGDVFVQEAVVVGLLEDFQNCLLSNKYELTFMEKYMKPVTKKYWVKLIKLWNGEIPYIELTNE